MGLYVFRHRFAIMSYMKPLNLNRPHLIVMVGIPGAGKSFFAERFANTFGAPIISSSRLQTELFNTPSYNSDEQAIIDRIGNYMLEELLKTGQTVIYDGASGSRTERSELTKKAKLRGYETFFVWVQTESVAAKSRATKPNKDKPYVITNEQFDIAIKRFTTPNSNEKAVVISGKHTYASQLKIVLSRLVVAKSDMINAERPNPRDIDARRITIR